MTEGPSGYNKLIEACLERLKSCEGNKVLPMNDTKLLEAILILSFDFNSTKVFILTKTISNSSNGITSKVIILPWSE
jgi:hypothetical protein